jgi:hypothetical protein
MQLVKIVIKEGAREMCEPVQLGQGTSAGTQCMGAVLSNHMKVHPTRGLYKDDTDNAFSSADRTSVMEEIYRPGSKLVASTNFFVGELRPHSHIYGSMGGKLRRLYVDSSNCGQRGALSARLGHNAAVQLFYVQVATEIGLVGGKACALCNDFLVAGR